MRSWHRAAVALVAALVLGSLFVSHRAASLHLTTALTRGGRGRGLAEAADQTALYPQLGQPRVRLRYTVCTGLINQFYGHLSAFALASALGGADLELPPALSRKSFHDIFSTNLADNEMTWSAVPTDTLLDVAAVTRAWAEQGVRVQQAPLLDVQAGVPPGQAYPRHTPEGLDPRLVARLEKVYLRPRHVKKLAGQVWAAVANLTAAAGQQDPSLRAPALVAVDLPCTMFAVHTRSSLALAGQVALSLEWSPVVRALAERVVERLSEGGTRPYNGAHLRLERDASHWKRILGGQRLYWEKHIQAMRAAGFSNGTQLYVACGLLSYGNQLGWEQVAVSIARQGLGGEVRAKEHFLSAQELAGLNTEQLALVDLLVLARAERFVGFGASSFSFFLREYRALRWGRPKSSAVLVNASRVGTETLFKAAAVLAPDSVGSAGGATV